VSGFAGVVSCDGAPIDETLLHRIAQHLKFRGADGTNIGTDQCAGFCFTFTRTGPAPQSENLPITQGGEQWLIGDIRLDGRNELRKRLNQAGCRVSDEATDEELTIHAWRAQGLGTTDVLLGDYSFAIWEPFAKRLVCIRDVIGSRPFFYAHVERAFWFSNTLDSLRLVPGIDLQLDEQFLGDFLLQGWCADLERTVYRGIRRLKPGHILEMKNGSITVRRLIDLPMKGPLRYQPPELYVEEFQSIFAAAVSDRIPRGNVAFFMSGGLDSTSVAATARQVSRVLNSSSNFRAYTVDFRPLFDDQEALFAGSVARHSDIPLEIAKAGDEVPFASWTDNSIRFPEPLHEPFQSRHVQMCRQVYAFARVALSGDGGDDILTGTAAPFASYLAKQGKFVELAQVFGSYLWMKRRIPPMGIGLKRRWRRWRSQAQPDSKVPVWIRSETVVRLRLHERLAALNRGHRHEHPFHPAGHAALSQGYWAGVLEDEDAAWLGVPLERRSPFLDRRVIEFLLRVPPIPWCAEKELLRQAMKGLLPEDVRTRRKTPLFQSPFALQVQRLNWSPLPLPKAHPLVAELVDWSKLDATLRTVSGSQLWDDLRPVSLNHWVKGVENDHTFL
jgi:asparagine synthase (glutamine-hydrolysing)